MADVDGGCCIILWGEWRAVCRETRSTFIVRILLKSYLGRYSYSSFCWRLIEELGCFCVGGCLCGLELLWLQAPIIGTGPGKAGWCGVLHTPFIFRILFPIHNLFSPEKYDQEYFRVMIPWISNSLLLLSMFRNIQLWTEVLQCPPSHFHDQTICGIMTHSFKKR